MNILYTIIQMPNKPYRIPKRHKGFWGDGKTPSRMTTNPAKIIDKIGPDPTRIIMKQAIGAYYLEQSRRQEMLKREGHDANMITMGHIENSGVIIAEVLDGVGQLHTEAGRYYADALNRIEERQRDNYHNYINTLHNPDALTVQNAEESPVLQNFWKQSDQAIRDERKYEENALDIFGRFSN